MLTLGTLDSKKYSMKITIQAEQTGDEAFMAIELNEGALDGIEGVVVFPEEYNV